MFNVILHKQFEIDKEEMSKLFEDKDEYLCKSVEAYLYCLELGLQNTGFDEIKPIFRLVSLWTQNSKNLKVNQIVKEKIFKIATFKFCVLMHQLAARMSLKNCQQIDVTTRPTSAETVDEALFQSILFELIVKISQEHPYQMLPIILAFSNAHKVNLF